MHNIPMAQKKNSSFSFGQAGLTLCLPGATSCLSYLMILFEDDWFGPCLLENEGLKVTCTERPEGTFFGP